MKTEKTIHCNGCGRRIGKDENGVMEEMLMVEWNWGYFSRKDGEKHSFCLCEKCYDRLRASFLLPVQVENYL